MNDYHIDDELGSGSFATVYLCTRASDQLKYAVKVFNKSKLQRQRTFSKAGGVTSAMDKVAEEVAIMKKLQHPNLVRYFNVYYLVLKKAFLSFFFSFFFPLILFFLFLSFFLLKK